jgi:hypothetical protein
MPMGEEMEEMEGMKRMSGLPMASVFCIILSNAGGWRERTFQLGRQHPHGAPAARAQVVRLHL